MRTSGVSFDTEVSIRRGYNGGYLFMTISRVFVVKLISLFIQERVLTFTAVPVPDVVVES